MVSGPVLAIDQGTSGTKALVVCPERGVLASATVEVHPRHGSDGSVEVDPQTLLDSAIDAGRAALSRAGEPVVAVGLANQGETILAWDRATGRPLSPAIVWQDRRSAQLCRDLAEHAARLRQLTGLPLDPYFCAPKMAWLRHRLATGQAVVTTSDTWLVHQLTGAFVTDATTASRTMLLGLDDGTWSSEALALFGLADLELPRVVDCAGAVGQTSAFGPSALAVTGLIVDQQAALLAQHCHRAGQAKCTYGTGAFLLANLGPQATRSRAGLSTSVAWQLGGERTYCVDGQAYTVSSAVRWLVDLGVIHSARDLDVVGSTVPDAGGAIFVPALAGLGAPHWRAEATATLTGLTLGTRAAHLVRALIDGIAAQVADLAQAVQADLADPLAALRVDGGLTRSRLLMQAQADLLQVPVEVHAWPDATALGAAAVAMLGTDPNLTLDDVVPAPAPSRVFEPAISTDQAQHRMAGYRAVIGS